MKIYQPMVRAYHEEPKMLDTSAFSRYGLATKEIIGIIGDYHLDVKNRGFYEVVEGEVFGDFVYYVETIEVMEF
ncbi:MAG: hypothetical protein DRJ03_27135 [Chloroflexi bacterium]|nr:MAG: hypothetical protein DRJ03_27135 [Chloroflexota bacterium]